MLVYCKRDIGQIMSFRKSSTFGAQFVSAVMSDIFEGDDRESLNFCQVDNLEKDKEKATRQIDAQKTLIENLKKEIEDWAERLKHAEQKETDLGRELNATKDQLASKRSECERWTCYLSLNISTSAGE